MRWYFASRMRHKEKLVKVASYLKDKGEEVISNWLREGSLKPYHENLEKVQNVATQITTNLAKADIFVLISDPEGTDMFIELGFCLAKNQIVPESVKIYIVGEYSKRSLMQLHPAIVHVADLCELFKRENVDCQDLPVLDLS